MAERLVRKDQPGGADGSFDPVAEAASLELPAHVAHQLWREAIADAGDKEAGAQAAMARFRHAVRGVASDYDVSSHEPGKQSRTVSPRLEPTSVIARSATGAVGQPSDRALELAARSQGRRLSLAMQHRFAYLFDHGFEHVELHTDAAARDACEALAARGFTLGSHVYVTLDDQQLETPAGGDLLMHELAHVVQYERGQLAGTTPRVTEPDDWVEHAAHHLVAATQPRRERLEAGAPVARAQPAARGAAQPVGPAVIARDALGTLHAPDLALDIEEPGVSVHVLITLTPQQAERFQADPSLSVRFARDFARALAPAGRPRFESRELLESTAITNRLSRDLDAWLDGRGLPQTTGFLDQRSEALGRLNLLAPLERTLATRGFSPGSIDWMAVVPRLLAEPLPRPARTLVEASVQDRYHLFLRAIMTEAAARPSVVGATVTAAQLAPVLRDYVDHLDRSAFGEGVSIFSEAFLAKWALDVQALRYTPDGFDVEQFRPTTSQATLESERTRVLDEFKRTRMPNLIVAYVRDHWSASAQTPDGYLEHVDMASLRQGVVTRMVDEFLHIAATDPGYRAALRNATHDQARFDAIRTLFTLATALERSNQDLALRLTTTPIDELGTTELEIADDPAGYYRSCSGVSQATMAMFTTLQRGGDLAATFDALPDVEAAAAVRSATALVALFAHLRAMRSIREQQQNAVRADLREQIDLRYDDVVRIVQTMWDDAEVYVRDVYIPKLKEVAVRILTQNRDELARWHDNWDTQTPRQIASYRIAALGLEDVARKLRSGEATSIELDGQILLPEDLEDIDNAVTTLRALADRLASPEGAEEKRSQLREAIEVFDRTRANILDGTYPPYLWGGAVAATARQELGIGEFPEYTTYGQVFAGRVQASQNPFLARVVVGWEFRERVEAEFQQVAVLVGLGLLTIASILVPGVGGLILTAVDILVNIGVATSGVVDARRALDLALLDPHLELQGISVEQARTAMNDAWIGLALSILLPLGIAAFTGAMVIRQGRAMRALARDMPHVHALYTSDPVRLERLMRMVPDLEHLNRLLGAVGDARRLEIMLFHSEDGASLERLLRRVPDTVKLASWLERAGNARSLTAVLDRTANAAEVDALAARYGDRWAELERHLSIVGSDTGAGARLQALLDHTGGSGGFQRMLTSIGTEAQQTTFLRAIERDPARGVALAHAMAPAPGLANRMVRHMGANMVAHLSVEGSALRIHGELTIAPETLATVSDADMPVLVRACENPAAHAADIARFEGGNFRFRFRTRVNQRVDPWITTMLHEAGFGEGTPQHALFQNLSEADKQQLWDLPNNRGRDPEIRPQAARWALGRQQSSVHQFVADFQFYVGEVDRQTDIIEINLQAEAHAQMRSAEAANGGRPLTARQIENVYRAVTREPPRPGGLGGLGREFVNLRGAARRAIRQRAVEEMSQPGAGGRTVGAGHADASAARIASQLTGDFAVGETHLVGRVDPATLPAQVRDQVATINFADEATAAYHAHVHTREIEPADYVPGRNQFETYLNTAREGIRSGTPSTPVRRQDGAWSISFARGSGTTIVTVTPDGIATIATYIPRR